MYIYKYKYTYTHKYVCIFIYIYIYIYMYIHIFTCSTYMYICIYIDVCRIDRISWSSLMIRIYIHMHTHVYIFICPHIHNVPWPQHLHMCACARVRAFMCMCVSRLWKHTQSSDQCLMSHHWETFAGRGQLSHGSRVEVKNVTWKVSSPLNFKHFKQSPYKMTVTVRPTWTRETIAKLTLVLSKFVSQN